MLAKELSKNSLKSIYEALQILENQGLCKGVIDCYYNIHNYISDLECENELYEQNIKKMRRQIYGMKTTIEHMKEKEEKRRRAW